MLHHLLEFLHANSIDFDSTMKVDQLDMVNSTKPNTLSFIDDIKYIDQLISNSSVVAVIARKELKEQLNEKRPNLFVIEHDDPRWLFYSAYNYIGKKHKIYFDSTIDSTATIHPRAFVAEKNVKIGKHCIIYPNATILEDVEIGDHCVIQSGAVIGSEGYEYKRTSRGILGVYHDGKVIIGNRVEIGPNTCVDKGFSYRQTIISDDVKIDNLVYIAHAVQIGEGSFIIASSTLVGSVTVGSKVWVGPNSTISHVTLGDSSFITLGSVVVRDTKENEMVSGNWAVPHSQFVKILKKNLKDINPEI